MYDQDEYEYRIGYQYKDGTVSFTDPFDERYLVERLHKWQTTNRFMLLIDPWVEYRRITKWQRTAMPHLAVRQ